MINKSIYQLNLDKCQEDKEVVKTLRQDNMIQLDKLDNLKYEI